MSPKEKVLTGELAVEHQDPKVLGLRSPATR
jgi:hypothetical protein